MMERQTQFQRWAFPVCNHLIEQAEPESKISRQRQLWSADFSAIRHFEEHQEQERFVGRCVATGAINLERREFVQPVRLVFAHTSLIHAFLAVVLANRFFRILYRPL